MNTEIIPFHKPFITDDEINEVVDTLKSGWITTGPKTILFEEQFAKYIGCKHALAVNSCTAALHLALEAIGLEAGDEVIVPAITFTATAEVVCYFNAIPVIVDVEEGTLNISVSEVEKNITNKTKAILAVDYAGQPANLDELSKFCKKHKLYLIEDAAHALPAKYNNRMVGTISDITCFSFYATKTLATGEGGMICTNNSDIAERCAKMRLHGINKDAWKRYTAEGSWFYEVIAPGFKYNLSDLQSALGLAQLRKIDYLHDERKKIVDLYNEGFSSNKIVSTLNIKSNVISAYHLYPIFLNLEKLKIDRSKFIDELRLRGIIASVHFIPLYRHPYYKQKYNLSGENYPVSESYYPRIVSLPLWPGMDENQINQVIHAVNELTKEFSK